MNRLSPAIAEKNDPQRAYIYALQRHIVPSKLTEAAAWQFEAHSIQAASPEKPAERHIIDTTIDLCRKRHIKNVPAIFIVDSHIPNAASISGREMIVTTAIMKSMSPDQLEAIIGHELSHHRHTIRDSVAQFVIGYTGATIAHESFSAAVESVYKSGRISFVRKGKYL
jgi:Zn-dependent protease with chaperone function